MKLRRHERDWYAVGVTESVSPSVLTGPWEASFDCGATWVAGEQITVNVDGQDVQAWAWLVAGPDFDAGAIGQDPGDTQATIASTLVPRVRNATDAVVVIEEAPPIELVR